MTFQICTVSLPQLNNLDLKTLWRTRPLFRWLVGLEVVFLIAMVALCIYFVSEPAPLPFNSEVWDLGVGPARYSMVKDLIGSGRLIGKNVKELEKLLGTRLCLRKVEDEKVVQLSYAISKGLKDTYLDLDFKDNVCIGAQIRRPVEPR
jgi:hypothetical protein